MKKCYKIFAICAMLMGSFYFGSLGILPDSTVEASEFEAENTENFRINLAPRTKEEIREFVKRHPAKVNDEVKTLVEPSFKKKFNEAGVLSQETLQSALNITNQIRFIAGLSGMVSLNKEYVKLTQAASYINALNDNLTHSPEKPKGVSESLYREGYEGASSSNISMGHGSINNSIVFGYMEDGDPENIDRIGHRRWILNPSMGATGFGYAGNYSALYAFDRTNTEAGENGVMWPAMTMPTDYFNSYFPWSISFEDYVPESVSVSLERLSDGKKWEFSSGKSDGYFNISNAGYGQRGCIIFRPEKIEEYQDGDEFQVTIHGLGSPLSYKVSFFDLIPVTGIFAPNKKMRVELGSGFDINFKVVPEDASNPYVLLRPDKKNIFEMSGNYLYPKQYGKTKISGKTVSGGYEAEVQVEVVPSAIWSFYTGRPYGNSLWLGFNRLEKVAGYEIQYALDRKFTKEKKSVKTKKTEFTLKQLKKKKTYYIRVRGFAKTKEGRVYGDFSEVKKVKTY